MEFNAASLPVRPGALSTGLYGHSTQVMFSRTNWGFSPINRPREVVVASSTPHDDGRQHAGLAGVSSATLLQSTSRREMNLCLVPISSTQVLRERFSESCFNYWRCCQHSGGWHGSRELSKANRRGTVCHTEFVFIMYAYTIITSNKPLTVVL